VKRFIAATTATVLVSCAQTTSGHGSSQAVAPAVPATASQGLPLRRLRRASGSGLLGNGTIAHVIIVFQENRSTDDLFYGLHGANTVKAGINSAGTQISLRPQSLTAPYDVDHSHYAFEVAFDGGKMDGFNLEQSSCPTHAKSCPQLGVAAYGYVPQSEVKPYFTMAEQYAFADDMFATQSGPSFAAHQYIISGTSTIATSSTLRAAELPLDAKHRYTGGCDSPSGSLVMLIDGNGTENQQVYPCFDRPALSDLVEAKGLTWRYYQSHPGAGLWNAPDAIKHIRNGSQFSTEVVSPPSQVLTDIANGALPNVVWVTPTAKESDHAGITDGTGPSWVASVVNAVGESQYWDSSVIFVTWDDWGGWYDHVTPPQYNSFELGIRVPLIAIGPYAKKGYVSHAQHEFGSILKFVEEAFGLPSLGTTDERADNLADCFNFSRKPRPFKPIASSLHAAYFLHRPMSYEEVDY
jgi:phospholipase C